MMTLCKVHIFSFMCIVYFMTMTNGNFGFSVYFSSVILIILKRILRNSRLCIRDEITETKRAQGC